MDKIINCTTHNVRDLRTEISYAPCGLVARVEVVSHQKHLSCGTTIFTPHYGAMQGLPDPVEDTYYIVSSVVLNAMQGKRFDLMSPAGTVKDAQGKIIGSQGFRSI